MRNWTLERTSWLEKNQPPLSSEQEVEYRKLFPVRMEAWLDQGLGDCVLENPGARSVVEKLLESDLGTEIDSFVIMPNHIHLIAKIDGEDRLPNWMRTVKGRSAFEINRLLGRSGKLWQSGYWDRIVRDESHLYRCRCYTARNPEKANLCDEKYTLFLTKEVGL